MNPLKQKLDINNERYRIIVSIKEDYLDGKLSLEEGNRILKEKLGTCTPDEFAYAEQSLKGVYKDEEIPSILSRISSSLYTPFKLCSA